MGEKKKKEKKLYQALFRFALNRESFQLYHQKHQKDYFYFIPLCLYSNMSMWSAEYAQ